METFVKKLLMLYTIIVHGGKFHADDATCVAIARIINPKCIVIRTNTPEGKTDIEKGYIIADIGGGIFDHHQADCPIRSDGVKHCAASLMWLMYGYTFVHAMFPKASSEAILYAVQYVYKTLMKSIAVFDNGDPRYGDDFGINAVVNCYIPNWNSKETMDDGFNKAVEFMMDILKLLVTRAISNFDASTTVRETLQEMTEDGVVVFNEFVPWQTVVVENQRAKVVVFPSSRGGWQIQLVPIALGSFETRVRAPEEWLAKSGKDAETIQRGMTFCHANGFTAAFKTKDEAIEGAHEVIRRS